ncbi:MAG: arylamine N-acetyltransferase [Alphaproteobacteria bacterium]|nr:arylamine N-acetyltransferase [Alphaproteobacteria bacterium]
MTIDLDAYFRRIGHQGGREPTLETLRALCLSHPKAIPFENLDPLMGRPVELDPVALQRKLVAGGRGGYCYEHGLLLFHVLRALGFEVSGLSARVIKNLPPSGVRARTHMLLRINLDGVDYVADVGFGISTLSAPLRLETRIAQPTPHETFRLADHEGLYEMQIRIGDAWDGLYRFDLQPQAVADYEVSNWYNATHPASNFVTDLMAARVDDGCRHTLRNGMYALRFPDGTSQRRRLETVAELRAALTELFRVTLPDTPDLDPALGRVLART